MRRIGIDVGGTNTDAVLIEDGKVVRAVKAPTARKLQQAIGRLIRSETDRGVAVILDRRAVQFKDMVEARKSDDPVSDVQEFFEFPPAKIEQVPAARASRRRGIQL